MRLPRPVRQPVQHVPLHNESALQYVQFVPRIAVRFVKTFVCPLPFVFSRNVAHPRPVAQKFLHRCTLCL